MFLGECLRTTFVYIMVKLYVSEITDKDGNQVLSHSPKDIIEQFLSNPATFINFLGENYLPHFSSINDADNAAASLSMADCVMSEWRVRQYIIVHNIF